jgi:hypothetical protein
MGLHYTTTSHSNVSIIHHVYLSKIRHFLLKHKHSNEKVYDKNKNQIARATYFSFLFFCAGAPTSNFLPDLVRFEAA